MKSCTNGDANGPLCYDAFLSSDKTCIGVGGCTIWGGVYNVKDRECDWSGGKAGADEFNACPDLKVYDDEQDCDPACTLTDGKKSSKDGPCVWDNVNGGQLTTFA